MDNSDTIYRENDAQTVSSDSYGDRLTTLTVRNTGTLPDDEIAEIALLQNGTEIVTVTTPDNGTWVFPVPVDHGWFGPTGNGTAFSLRPTVADSATGGTTVELVVPAVNDSGTAGVYDPGDTGVFFEQDSPAGNLGPGPIMTVPADESPAGGSQEPTPVDIDVSVPSSTVATNDPVPVRISTNASSGELRTSLEYATNNTTVTQQVLVLGGNGTVETSFEPDAGRYRIRVTETESGAESVSAPFEVTPPVVRFTNETITVSRGETATLSLILQGVPSADIRLEDTQGRTLSSETLSTGSGDTYTVGLDTTGFGGGTRGAGFVATGNRTLGPLPNRDGGKPTNRTDGRGSRDGPPGAESERIGRSSSGAGNASARGVKPSADPANQSARLSGTNGTNPGTEDGSPSSEGGRPPLPLGVGRYLLSLSAGGNVTDTATLVVTDDWSGRVETLVAPADANLSNLESVDELATARSRIAAGDTLVLRVTTSGLGRFGKRLSVGRGRPDSPGNSMTSTASAGRSEGQNGSSTATSGRSGGPNVGGPTGMRNATDGLPGAFAALERREARGPPSGVRPSAAIRQLDTPDPETFLFVVPTEQNGTRNVAPGTEYGASFGLTETSPFVDGLDTSDTVETDPIRTNLSVVEPRATFAALSENDTLDLPPEGGVPIRGSTTVAPNTVATVHLNSTDGNESFTLESETTVDSDGTYETTVDLSDYEPGTNYTVSVTANDEQISPLRTGQLAVTNETSFAAAGGGGGAGMANSDGSSPEATTTTLTKTEPTSTTATTTDPGDDFDLPVDPPSLADLRHEVTTIVPKLRIGLVPLLLAALGLLALVFLLVGVRRML